MYLFSLKKKERGSEEERRCFLDPGKFSDKYAPEKKPEIQKYTPPSSSRPSNPKKDGYRLFEKVEDPKRRFHLDCERDR